MQLTEDTALRAHAKNDKDNLIALVLTKTDGEFLKRIDLCIVPPPPNG